MDDYVDLPISVHPRTEHNQINISFWSYGGNTLSATKGTHVLESGSSLVALLIFTSPLIQDYTGRLGVIIHMTA